MLKRPQYLSTVKIKSSNIINNKYIEKVESNLGTPGYKQCFGELTIILIYCILLKHLEKLLLKLLVAIYNSNT